MFFFSLCLISKQVVWRCSFPISIWGLADFLYLMRFTILHVLPEAMIPQMTCQKEEAVWTRLARPRMTSCKWWCPSYHLKNKLSLRDIRSHFRINFFFPLCWPVNVLHGEIFRCSWLQLLVCVGPLQGKTCADSHFNTTPEN